MLSFVHQSIATTRGRPASLAEEQDEGTPEFPISFHCLGVHEGEKDRKQDSYKINDPSSLELDILFIRGGVINQEPLHYNKNRPRAAGHQTAAMEVTKTTRPHQPNNGRVLCWTRRVNSAETVSWMILIARSRLLRSRHRTQDERFFVT